MGGRVPFWVVPSLKLLFEKNVDTFVASSQTLTTGPQPPPQVPQLDVATKRESTVTLLRYCFADGTTPIVTK
jgi:hypothetical protein